MPARVAGVLCATLLVAAAAGCGGESARERVLLVGDSIFAGASDELKYVLRSQGWNVTIDARPGAGIRNGGMDGNVDWPSRLRELVAFVDPRMVVVELGTNGCGACLSIPAAIEDDMRQLASVDHVLWVEVATFGPRAELGRTVDAALEAAAERWDNLELLPYDEWFEGRPDLVPPDDVHPTPAGREALAHHVADALAARAGPPEGDRPLFRGLVLAAWRRTTVRPLRGAGRTPRRRGPRTPAGGGLGVTP